MVTGRRRRKEALRVLKRPSGDVSRARPAAELSGEVLELCREFATWASANSLPYTWKGSREGWSWRPPRGWHFGWYKPNPESGPDSGPQRGTPSMRRRAEVLVAELVIRSDGKVTWRGTPSFFKPHRLKNEMAGLINRSDLGR